MSDFLNWELTNRIHNLGYDGKTLMYIDDEEDIINDDSSELIGAKPAILISAAFRWFREKYGLYSHVRESYAFDNTLEFVSQINGSYVNHGVFDKPINRFETYEEAESACLDKLIELVKNEQIKNS